MIPRFIQTTFCDDIRHEVGGKLSFMGIYSSVMYVPNFPITIPKFCISAVVVTPVQKPYKKLIVQVRKDDDILVEMTSPEAVLKKAGDDAAILNLDVDQRDRCQSLRFMTAIVPFQLDAPCILRVRAQTETRDVRGLGLRVEQAIRDTAS